MALASVTQATSKSTGVTLNAQKGKITLNNASLADATSVSFTVTNSKFEADDNIVVNHHSGGTAGAYAVHANALSADGSFKITVRNLSGGALGEAIVLVFAIMRRPLIEC